jgi:hypothetical protein
MGMTDRTLVVYANCNAICNAHRLFSWNASKRDSQDLKKTAVISNGYKILIGFGTAGMVIAIQGAWTSWQCVSCRVTGGGGGYRCDPLHLTAVPAIHTPHS